MKLFFIYLSNKIGISKLINWTEINYVKFIIGTKKFLENISNEAAETKEAAVILRKYIITGKITPEDELIFKNQLIDVFKALGIGIPFILIPGASILLPFIIKLADKFNINIFPSSFNDKKSDKNHNN